MSRYSDEKNPYHNCDNSSTCDERDDGTSDCGDYYFTCERKELWQEGYLAAEKEYALTGEERDLFLFMADYCPSYYMGDVYRALRKKVLGEHE